MQQKLSSVHQHKTIPCCHQSSSTQNKAGVVSRRGWVKPNHQRGEEQSNEKPWSAEQGRWKQQWLDWHSKQLTGIGGNSQGGKQPGGKERLQQHGEGKREKRHCTGPPRHGVIPSQRHLGRENSIIEEIVCTIKNKDRTQERGHQNFRKKYYTKEQKNSPKETI